VIQALLKKFTEIEYRLLFAVSVLVAVGLVAMYSIAFFQETGLVQNAFFKQTIFLLPAFLALLIVLFIPYRLIHKYAYLLYLLALVGIVLPYFTSTTAGTHRWLDLGPISFQPAEYAKWIIVLTLARYLSDRTLEMRYLPSLVIPILIAFIPAVIVLKQPDLGTALIMMAPVLPMMYWVGARPYHLFLIVAPLVSVLTAFHVVSFTIWGAVMVVIIFLARPKLATGVVTYFLNIFLGLLSPVIWNHLHEYQQKRILTLFNPDLDPLGAAYQIIQSKTAIGSGGLWGKGWGQGTQTHLKFLPVQETDFILSVIGEELGFVTIALLIIVFTWLVLKIVKLAYLTKDRFSGLVLIGIATIFLSHFFINSAMTVGLLPVKGLPLPFVSYGGSFLVSCFIMIGLVLNLSLESPD
jgi:rod shape determining protein RodA